MPAPVCILLFGRDDRLLDSRRLLLEARGYRALCATELSQASQLLTAESIRLVLFCHSVPAVEVETLAALATALPAPARCLALVAGDLRAHLDLPVAAISSREGPARLLQMIAVLLKTPTSPR